MMSRSNRGPDTDMNQPKAYRPSIDPKHTQPTMSTDTRHKQFKPTKTIDFNNKIIEYQPNNEYYRKSFWDAPRRKVLPKPEKEEPPKSPPARPPPKKQPPKHQPPKTTKNTLQPLPGANFNAKKAPAPEILQEDKPALPKPQTASYPVRHFEEVEPEAWSSPPPNVKMERWGEPNKAIPDLNPPPVPVKREEDFVMLPSTVGSMSRMIAMFTR